MNSFPKSVKWMVRAKRWAKTGSRMETHVKNENELQQMLAFLKSDTKFSLIMIEDIVEINEENK